MSAGVSPAERDPRLDAHGRLNVEAIRRDFPILDRRIHGKPLVYLDSAATSQKPQVVIDTLVDYYERLNANVHRGAHTLAEEATEAYENARAVVARMVGADASQVVWTRSTTESLNLLAYAWARRHLRAGDVVLLTEMEHHSNIVPWQILAREVGARLLYVPFEPSGQLCQESFRSLLTEKIRVFSLVHASNVLGTVNPVREMIAQVRQAAPEALCVVDGAQSVPHMPVNFHDLGCDFLAFSGHKLYGPMGVGALVGRRERLEAMEPFHGGGEMIETVTFDKTTFAAPPHRFEAGTPNVAGALGLAAAAEYLMSLGMERVRRHSVELTDYALDRLRELGGVTVYGPFRGDLKSGLVTFVDRDVHAQDLAAFLDSRGIAIRAGHHCAQPLHQRLGIAASARASFGVYNTREEVDTLIEGIIRARKLFGKRS
ncbi:MAG: cysteine desulfurase [Acidobacteriota bacterium]|nr:cysteine desulfurase [Acidobacteriota bacterium]